MANSPVPRFDCPSCGTPYSLVRVETDLPASPAEEAGDIACAVCGGPLRARDGQFILKYFVLRRIGPPERDRYSVL